VDYTTRGRIKDEAAVVQTRRLAMNPPRIWYIKWMSDVAVQVGFNYRCQDGLEGKLAFSDAVRGKQPVDDRRVPEFLHYGYEDHVAGGLRDAFSIVDGLLVCSPAFRDVLVAHDLGATRLHEVPIYADAEGTKPSGLPPHYLLHVLEAKPGTFVPEQSENVKQFMNALEKTPRPDAPWEGIYRNDILAARADAAEGVDLWHDPNLLSRLFLSNRLAQAIRAAGLKSRALKLHEAKIVSD
jgi:hypothetical protein